MGFFVTCHMLICMGQREKIILIMQNTAISQMDLKIILNEIYVRHRIQMDGQRALAER